MLLVFGGLGLWAAPVAAMVSDVAAPQVEAGVAQVDLRVGLDRESEAEDISRQRIHYDYGFTDALAARICLREQYTGSEHLEHQAVEGMLRWQWFEHARAGLDGGLRLAYRFRDGDKKPDELVLSWVSEQRRGAYAFRQNLLLGWATGAEREAGTDMEWRWQVLRSVDAAERFWLGAEMFNGIGTVGEGLGYDEQTHSAGPVARWLVTEKLRYQFGLLRGLSEAAPDYAAKLFINLRF